MLGLMADIGLAMFSMLSTVDGAQEAIDKVHVGLEIGTVLDAILFQICGDDRLCAASEAFKM